MPCNPNLEWLCGFQWEQNRKRYHRVVAALTLTLGVNAPLQQIFTARKRSLRRLCFSGICLSTRGGGVRGCSRGGWGVRGCSRGACVVAPGGHAWLLQGGMHGCSWGGIHGCSRGGVHGCSRGGVHGCSWGGMRGCSWGCVRGCSGGACVVFSMRYGQWAGGTHPTGMHSCLAIVHSSVMSEFSHYLPRWTS